MENMNSFQPWLNVGGTVILLLLSVIAFFLRSILSEQRQSREEITGLMRTQAVDDERFRSIQDTLVTLQQADTKLMEQLTDALTRLIRLEERSRRIN